jgi:uncharacterized protein YdhG (YjbR/CyaY superfamily)
MKKIDEDGHKLHVLWAAECAEHVLSYFEKNHPNDDRPRKAIEAARAWVIGELKTSKVRKFAIAAHAAARAAVSSESVAAARSAGHAAATTHVPGHANYAASYAFKAAIDPEAERDWQLRKLPDHLKLMIQLPEKRRRMKHSYKNVDEYISNFPQETQDLLEQIREIIKHIAPVAKETISYGMPAYRLNDRPLVYFAAFKKHIGFYATPTGHKEFTKELSQFKHGKGSVQFPLDKPIPFDLIRKIVKFRIKENLAKSKGSKS